MTLAGRRAGRHAQGMTTTPEFPVTDHQGLEIIGYDECWRLIGSVPVGRVAFAEGGEVTVLPVNHAVAGRRVVFRTHRGSLLHEALVSSAVAFEADGFDAATRTGWSVLVRGVADLVPEGDEVLLLNLRPWADSVDKDDWVMLVADEVTGRRITRP